MVRRRLVLAVCVALRAAPRSFASPLAADELQNPATRTLSPLLANHRNWPVRVDALIGSESRLVGIAIFLLLYGLAMVASLALVGVVLVRLPANHFQETGPARWSVGNHGRVAAWAAWLARNGIGVLLIVVGIGRRSRASPDKGF